MTRDQKFGHTGLYVSSGSARNFMDICDHLKTTTKNKKWFIYFSN